MAAISQMTDTCKHIFLNENVRIAIEMSLKCVPKDPIDNKPALVEIMAWRWPGDKPLSEPMLAWVTNRYMLHSAAMSYGVSVVGIKCDMAFIVPMHRNKPNITYLLTVGILGKMDYAIKSLAC